MTFPHCPIHPDQQQNFICWAPPCMGTFCPACFAKHHEGHDFGVAFNEDSRGGLLEWNQFMLEKVREIRDNITNRGYTFFFVLRLESSFPRELVCDISKVEIERVALQTLLNYEEALDRNITSIKGAASLNDLNVPDFLKDLYNLFVENSTQNLSFLVQEMQQHLRVAHPLKKIYHFTHFLFSNKELSQIETRRKSIVHRLESACMLKLTHSEEPYSPSKKSKSMQSGELHQGLNLVDISNFILSFSLDKVQEPKKEPESEPKSEAAPADAKIEEVNILTLQNLTLRNELERAHELLTLKERSICELNKLINNEEEELIYRENEVELLTGEVKKLLEYKKKYERLEGELQKQRSLLAEKDRNIKELNKVISNEEEELAYRENEVDDLMSDLRKIVAAKNNAEEQLKSLSEQEPEMLQKISILSNQNENMKEILRRVEGYEGNESAWEELITEVVELEASLALRGKNLCSAMEIAEEAIAFAPAEKQEEYRSQVRKLREASLRNQ